MSALSEALRHSEWTIDIERFPAVAYEWSARHGKYTSEHMRVSEARMSSWAAINERGLVRYADLHTHGHEAMIRSLWQTLNEADEVVTYNGKRFDEKHWFAAFADASMPPPRPYKHTDLLATVRRRFGWDYKGLKSVAARLNLAEQKADTIGFDMWRGCMDGDPESWRMNREYNIQDVRTTQALKRELLPWLVQPVNAQLWAGEDACPICSSTEPAQSIGDVAALTNSYPGWRCTSCGGVTRSNHRRRSTTRRAAAL